MTDAMMTVTNDYAMSGELVTTSDTVEMYATFPNQTVAAGQTSPASYVAAAPFPGQSQFKLSYASTGEDMIVKIGSWPYTTEVNYAKIDGGAGAMLAPTPGSDTDYSFSFFAGPYLLKTLVDSFIGANVPALLAWLRANPQQIGLTEGVTLTISQLELSRCETIYATLKPAQPGNTTRWQLTAIAEVGGMLVGTLAWDDITSDATASVGRLCVLAQATIDLGNPAELACTVTRLEFSIGSFKLGNALTDAIEVLFPVLYATLTSPYTLAGALNTNFNQLIVEKVNEVIAGLLQSTATAGVIAWLGRAGTGGTPGAQRGQRTTAPVGDNRTWMSTPAIQDRKLSELTLPGTHDSASYGLVPVLSQIKYSDIAFLWTLSPDPAPADGSFPFAGWPNDGGTLHVGADLMRYILDKVVQVSIAQDRTIREQLDSGIRYFDLRIYHDSDGYFYAQHGARGPRFEELLGDVRAFIDAHPDSGELIFLQISATNFGDDTPALPEAAARLMRHFLGDHIYLPAGAAGKEYDFQQLAQYRVGDITADAPKVILLNTDRGYLYADTVVNTRGFATSHRSDGGTDSVAELAGLEGTALDANTLPLYAVSWTLTPQPSDIVQYVLQNLGDHQPPLLIGELALVANTALAGFFADHRGRRCNLVTVDWYEVSSGAQPVDVIIGLNYPAAHDAQDATTVNGVGRARCPFAGHPGGYLGIPLDLPVAAGVAVDEPGGQGDHGAQRPERAVGADEQLLARAEGRGARQLDGR